LVSGLFTTFEGTRFSGVELFEHNPAGLLKIISTTKYDEVKAAAVGKLGENSIDQLKGLANNTRSVPVRNIALVRLIIIGEFDFIAEHHGKCAGEQPVVDVLGNHVDKITNQNLLRILGDKHKDQSIRKAALLPTLGREFDEQDAPHRRRKESYQFDVGARECRDYLWRIRLRQYGC
jgi:hypothetical protein